MKESNKKKSRNRMIKEKVGGLSKSDSLSFSEEFLDYLEDRIETFEFEYSYDVMANEMPFFKTIGFTEYANCILMFPLQPDLKVKQMKDALDCDSKSNLDYVEFFRDSILSKNANKYSDNVDNDVTKPKSHLIALPGDNKLKKCVSLKKLTQINNQHKGDVLIKPHPMTNFSTIGEFMDRYGEAAVSKRGDDLYRLLKGCDTLHTSILSESAMYATVLDKGLEPIDVYHMAKRGSFFHINNMLFELGDPKSWINDTFNSPKSGVICPLLDSNWKKKIDDYLDYINGVRESYRDKYCE